MDSEQASQVQYDKPHIMPRWVSVVMFVALVTVLVSAGFAAMYSGKAYPGVSVYGTYIGGLNRADAIAEVNKGLENYKLQSVPISYGTATVHLSPVQAGAEYKVEQTVDDAMKYGRTGGWTTKVYEQLRALTGRPTNYSNIALDVDKLSPLLLVIDRNVNRAVSNASFNVSGSSVTVTPGQAGRRLNLGDLVGQIEDRFGTGSTNEIAAPIADLPPQVDSASLESVREQATAYVSSPLTLIISGREFTLTQDQIVSWLKVMRPVTHHFEDTHNVVDLVPAVQPVTLTLDSGKLSDYVASLAAKTDQEGQNAALTIDDGRATIFKPSRDGLALNQEKAKSDILAALNKTSSDRKITLEVKVKKPDVTEDSLNDLGIKELIGEGVSYFPGSIPARVINIKLGAAQDNGLLIKPGEVFSFNEHFVDVDAAHGWQPGLSIIGNKIEPIYGGGICQVSSTAYRAALMAGLPIVERTNHAYAVSYYTAPYGVPGVDATVYNPGVDFKFRNDTGSYILMQTRIVGTTLYFDLYGTKTKSGRLRGPFFIDGSNDDKKPSTTIFYRDVLDLAGNVIKTDSVTTHYKSSLDFVHVDTP